MVAVTDNNNVPKKDLIPAGLLFHRIGQLSVRGVTLDCELPLSPYQCLRMCTTTQVCIGWWALTPVKQYTLYKCKKTHSFHNRNSQAQIKTNRMMLPMSAGFWSSLDFILTALKNALQLTGYQFHCLRLIRLISSAIQCNKQQFTIICLTMQHTTYIIEKSRIFLVGWHCSFPNLIIFHDL